ncbi:YfcZ/YiiS family protein [Photobacterium makurazakiensis]|uniref:YfcZ/YiiS family protein n=1 Tax=Photobacterium TaxID=657 RepID=UPI003D0C87ED
MANEELDLEYQACEACGVSAEMGFMINEGDDVAEVTIFAGDKAALEAELANYLALAKEVCANYKHDVSPLTDESTELTARIQFECSAEKLIFELKSRSLAR